MSPLQELVTYTNDLLEIASFDDYAPNGLQVEGRAEVRNLVSGVTACQELLEAAVDAGADAILVHHGYFWKGESRCVTGIGRRRLHTLLAHDISLLAYHLPLDAHPVYGNNARLAALLDIEIKGRFGPSRPAIGYYGRLRTPLSATEFGRLIAGRLGREPLHIPGGAGPVETVGWCSGAAQDYIDMAAALGVDAYLSGEISERTVHQARELGIHYFAAGHHATERCGVQALGRHIAATLDITHQYIDVENPV